LKKIIGQAWWTVIPPGSILVSPMSPIKDDDVAIFEDPDGNTYIVSLWDDLVKDFKLPG
jgi:hypothetical protein